MKSFVVGALKRRNKLPLWCLLLALLPACAANGSSVSMEPYTVASTAGTRLKVVPLDRFDNPWAMAFLPDQSLLITQKGGALWLLELAWQTAAEGNTDIGLLPSVVSRRPVSGLLDIRAAGQGGLGDVIVHPRFADNRRVYVSEH